MCLAVMRPESLDAAMGDVCDCANGRGEQIELEIRATSSPRMASSSHIMTVATWFLHWQGRLDHMGQFTVMVYNALWLA